MFPRLTSDRTAGILLVLLVSLLVASVFGGAGGVGLDTRSEYFFGDGPESWQVVAIQHRDQLRDGLILLTFGAVVAMSLAVVAYKTLQRQAIGSAAAISIGLLGAGILLLVGAGLSFWLADLAGQWTNSAGADADRIADTALSVHTARFFALLIGFPLILGSLLAFGVRTQLTGGLPRWLFVFPILGGGLLIISPVGFAGPGVFLFLMASGVILLSWLVVLAGTLVLRRTDQN